MTDTELPEGAQEVVESAAQPAPEILQTSEVQQPSVAGGLTEDRLQEILKDSFVAFREETKRDQQSQKDRRFDKLEKGLDELRTIKQRLEDAGGDWTQLEQEVQDTELQRRIDSLESKITSAGPVAGAQDWKQEWERESQKTLDAAAALGITLTNEEYSAALFGKKFATKGDAYASLNKAIYAKMRGEDVSSAAVVTEGGDLPRPAEETTFRQKFETAKSRDEKKAVLDSQWQAVGKELKKERARELLRQEGLSPEELA